MNAFLVFAEAQGGGQVEQIARTFGVDWPHLVAQIISFSIVCLILYLFAYKPILKMLAQRRELITQGLANSEKIKQELAKTETQRQEVLAKANIHATELIEEARAAAARLREQETQKAIAAAEQIMIKAREAAASDRSQMLTQLKREVGRLVVQTTAAITGKVLTTDDQRRLAEETARELRTR
jgi:F-type H+-transporting ATPase subunit b